MRACVYVHWSGLSIGQKKSKKGSFAMKMHTEKATSIDNIILTFANSHCSTHRLFRKGSSSSESEGCGVGGKPGRAFPSSFFFTFISAAFVFCRSLSPKSAATLNED